MYVRSGGYQPTEDQLKNWASYTRCRIQGLLVDKQVWRGTPWRVRRYDVPKELDPIRGQYQEHMILLRHVNDYKSVNNIPLEDIMNYYMRLGYDIHFDHKDHRVWRGHIIK